MTMTTAGPPRMIWARLAVDPLARPLAHRLAPLPGVTPNRITAMAFGLALGAAACFATGSYRWGGLLFLARYFFDCVDGMVAREQGTGSARGAALDISADVVGTHVVAALLTWRLLTDGHLAPGPALGLLALLGIHNWALGHRKHLAERAGLGDGGFDHRWHLPGLRAWTAYADRLGMAAFPWVLEVEIIVFGLAPLLLPADLLAWSVWFGCAGYGVVALVTLGRIQRIAAREPRELP
ncbi:CDP-alcohol phosphatidyltransferase family protein [Nocardioides daejeonensis]|uniref:CDP-alcohol phosphatidyltransferase family protein n=1 Tax=Nocardioides daejeonensis TaxID=1046556 RepID=UPI000D746595|nr:CDP-alcohol phosphatidyltransferase family protein [Nocardioides daejeonensis]